MFFQNHRRFQQIFILVGPLGISRRSLLKATRSLETSRFPATFRHGETPVSPAPFPVRFPDQTEQECEQGFTADLAAPIGLVRNASVCISAIGASDKKKFSQEEFYSDAVNPCSHSCSRAAGNRTQSLRTRSARTTGILRPATVPGYLTLFWWKIQTCFLGSGRIYCRHLQICKFQMKGGDACDPGLRK